MVRNKSSIDTGAAAKSKSAAVTSRYLLPKKVSTTAAGDAATKKVSPLAKKGVGGVKGSGIVTNAKRSPVVGWK